MVAHVPDVLEQSPPGFELYSPKTRFLIVRQRHHFKLIDPNMDPNFGILNPKSIPLNGGSPHKLVAVVC